MFKKIGAHEVQEESTRENYLKQLLTVLMRVQMLVFLNVSLRSVHIARHCP